MPLGDAVKAADNCRPSNTNKLTTPVSISSDWFTVVDPTGADGADGGSGTITNPVAEITNSTSHKVVVNRRGTTFLCRGKYDDGDTAPTENVVQIFGKDSNGLWMKLTDASGTHKLTLAVDTTNDVSDGTHNWTEPVEVDMQGCSEILVGISIAYADGDGTPTAAGIEGKIK